MNISKILEMKSDKVTDAEKLGQIATIVAAARKAYGNADATIPAEEINTPDGRMEVKYVNDATKLLLVKGEVSRIKVAVIEAVKADGINPLKVIEEMISTSPILVNISETSNFSYL